MKTKEKQRNKGWDNLKPCKKGETHNPNGRPPITKTERELREIIAKHAPELIAAMAKGGKQGSAPKAKMLLDKVIGNMASVEIKHSGSIELNQVEDLSMLSDEQLRQWAEIKKVINESAKRKP